MCLQTLTDTRVNIASEGVNRNGEISMIAKFLTKISILILRTEKAKILSSR